MVGWWDLLDVETVAVELFVGEIEGAGCCGTLILLGWEDGQELVRMSVEDVRVDGEEISKHGECGDGSFSLGCASLC